MKEQSDVQMRAERRVGVKQSVVKVCLLVSRLRIENYRNVRLNKEHAERDRKLPIKKNLL